MLNRLKLIYDSPFVKKIVQGTFWLTLGAFVSKGLVTIAYLVMARILTVEEYGEYGIIKSTIDNFLIFASMGIGLTTTKYVSELKEVNKEMASSIIGASILMISVLSISVFGLIFFFSDYIAANILDNESLILPLILGGGVLVFIALIGLFNGTLLGLHNYRSISIVNFIQGFLLFGFLVVGAYYKGVVGAVAGNLLAMILVCVVALNILRKKLLLDNIRISFKRLKESFRIIYKFAIPASLGMFILAPIIWILNTLLVNTPNGYEELGIYSAVMIFSLAIRTVNTSLSDTLLPVFLSKSVQITPKKEFFNYHGAWIISIIISMPIILIPEIVTFLLGSEYPSEKTKIILGLTICMTIFLAAKHGLSRDLIIKNKMWFSVFSTGQFGITTILMYFLLQDYGAIGFAIAFFVGYALNVLIIIPYFIHKKITPAYIFNSPWLIVIASLLLGLIFLNIYSENFLIRAVFSLVLLTGLYVSIKNFYRRVLVKKIE